MLQNQIDGVGTTLGEDEAIFCDVGITKGIPTRCETRSVLSIDDVVMETVGRNNK